MAFADVRWRLCAGWSGLALIAAACLWTFRAPVTQLDDAFISYRYAANFAHGAGLVFNPGEYVEGYTNLLWTLLVAAGIALGGDAPALGHWLGVLFATATLVGTYAYTLRLIGTPARPLLALLAPAGLLAANAFVCWTTAGLETPLFLWLIVAAALALAHGRRWVAAGLCLLATLTRPEGALVAACLLGVDLASIVRTMPRQQRPALAMAGQAGPVLLYAAGLGLLTLFRLWYYGDVVPNTFYAKVGGIPVSRGLLYLRNALVDGPALLLPGAILAAVRLPAFRPAFAFIALNAIYVAAIGGDVFPVGRFFLPCLPLLLAGATAGAATALPRPALQGGLLVALLPACILWGLYGTWPAGWGPPDYDFPHRTQAAFPHSAKRAAARVHYIFSADEDAQKHAQLAHLRAVRPPVRLLATLGIGKLGYWGGEFRILDMVGLTDRHIAHSGKVVPGTAIFPGHSRTDAAYVLARRPDVIELPRKGTRFLALPAFVELWNDPALEQLYHYDANVGGYVRN